MQQIYYIHNVVQLCNEFIIYTTLLTKNLQLYCFFEILSFCYALKRPSLFSYISPQKTRFSTIKYELTIKFLSANW